jgi:FkbM family methyltransferase
MSNYKIFNKFTRYKIIQLLLEKNIQISQYFMGIGSGGEVASSGENVIFQVLMNQCEAPYCIFDIGANKGQYVQVLQSTLKNRQYSIHCFEPDKTVYAVLEQMYQADLNVKLNRFALGNKAGTARLYYDKPGSKLASLTKRRLQHLNIHFDQHEVINVETIDNYCRQNSIDHIHLAKLDVEGHELDVLSGGEGMLKKGNIDIVAFEFGGCNIDTRTFLQDFYYLLSEKLCMKMYRVTPSGYLYKIDRYKEIHEQFRTSNFVAVKTNISIPF